MSRTSGSISPTTPTTFLPRASVAEGFRGLAFRLRVQGVEATLTESQLAELQKSCVAAAVKAGATLRA